MRRFIGFAVTILVVLLLLDRVAWFAAEHGLGQALRDSQNLSTTPRIWIRGYPFLTQAISGHYTQVDGRVDNLAVQDGVAISVLKVHLEGVHVSLPDLITQNVTGAAVDSAQAVGLVSFAALSAAVEADDVNPNLTLTFAQGDAPDDLKLTGNYEGLVISAKISGQARLTIQGGQLAIAPTNGSLSGLPGAIRSEVISLLGSSYKLPALPFGFQAQKVSVGPNGVTVTVSANNVSLTESGDN